MSERPRSTVPAGLLCVPAAGADTRRQLRSSNRQLLEVPRYRLNTYGCLAFSAASPQSGTLSRILSGTRPSVQTVSDVCLRRTCLLDTSALSALEVLRRLLRYINLLTYYRERLGRRVHGCHGRVHGPVHDSVHGHGHYGRVHERVRSVSTAV